MKERELFLTALEIEDPAARQAHLKTECAGDAELLARVESLLASHQGQSQFLNTPVVKQIEDALDAGAAATFLYGTSSTSDEELDATAFFLSGSAAMVKHDDDSDEEIPLNYLEPSTTPGSLGRLGHYEVLEVIGRGAFGIVLRAFDEKLQRVVAIKVMNPELAATSPARKRFLREAQAAAAIRHEHVVSIYAVEEKPLPYLVMEFIPGKTLQQRLDQSGPLDVPTVLRIGRQIAEGLAAAHAQDLIHRDIKPANILLESGAREMVKVTDFGLARAADDASLTQSGTIAGTPMYMAPEQALGHNLDQRVDLFSLGSVLYQMVSGRPPFRAPSTLAVMNRVTKDTPRPICEIIPETPQWLCDIIATLHAKNPNDRYQSAQEVADLFTECEVRLRPPARLSGQPLRSRPQPPLAWKWMALVAMTVLLSAVGLNVFNPFAGFATNTPPTLDSNLLPSSLSQSDPPEVAAAPFNTAQAQNHQTLWARHLGVPVEYTNSIGMTFRLVPPGEFLMGCAPEDLEVPLQEVGPDEGWQLLIRSESPARKTVLPQAVYVGIHEVTQANYKTVMGTAPAHFADTQPGAEMVAELDTAHHPVERVGWNDAVEFCARLSQREGLKPFHFRSGDTVTPLAGTGYRLLTEAEWEFACRAGTTTPYWCGTRGSDLIPCGWSFLNSGGRTHAVGELKANPFGLYDVHGNVWEWVQDEWHLPHREHSPEQPPPETAAIPTAGGQRVSRGGSWFHLASLGRSSTRFVHEPGRRDFAIGLRVALTVDAVKSRNPGRSHPN